MHEKRSQSAQLQSPDSSFINDSELNPTQDCSYKHEQSQPLHTIQVPSHSDLSKEESQIILNNQVKELEKRLDQGWFLVYKLWLYLSILGCAFLCTILSVVALDWSRSLWFYDMEKAKLCLALLFLPFCCLVWLLRQAQLEIVAMREKELKTARKAFDCMIGFIFGYSVLMVLCWAGMAWIGEEEKFGLMFFGFYVVGVKINIVNLCGANKVIALLSELEDLIYKRKSGSDLEEKIRN